MSFKIKYEITKKYLTSGTKRRPGTKMPSVKFIVAHDTGNPNSTALNNVNYYENSKNEISASAHLFVDDNAIYECVPALTGTPEKAWHVIYNKTKDNELYGADSNDAAIGVEYCYGSKINSNEAYKRYVWVMAYICYKFNLNPKTDITAHFILDPGRKSDPKSGLAASGRTYEQLLKDIVSEYEDCTKTKQEENEPMTADEKKQFEELKKQVESITKKMNMDIPTYAKASVDKLTKLKDKNGKPVVDTPNGRSADFYSLVTVLDRAGLFDKK
ncbi:N-acetylmuramoyl-L-alanine amidase [compost metagenome]